MYVPLVESRSAIYPSGNIDKWVPLQSGWWILNSLCFFSFPKVAPSAGTSPSIVSDGGVYFLSSASYGLGAYETNFSFNFAPISSTS